MASRCASRQARHARHHLGDLDEGQRVVAGELAVAHAEHGQGVHDLVAVGLLAEAASIHVPVQHGREIRAAPDHLVVHGDGARQLADPAGPRLARAEQADHVAAIRVEPQWSVRERARVGGQHAPAHRWRSGSGRNARRRRGPRPGSRASIRRAGSGRAAGPDGSRSRTRADGARRHRSARREGRAGSRARRRLPARGRPRPAWRRTEEGGSAPASSRATERPMPGRRRGPRRSRPRPPRRACGSSASRRPSPRRATRRRRQWASAPSWWLEDSRTAAGRGRAPGPVRVRPRPGRRCGCGARRRAPPAGRPRRCGPPPARRRGWPRRARWTTFCSTRSTAVPAWWRPSTTSKTWSTIAGASPSDGSSRSRSRGPAISARPIATICCSPARERPRRLAPTRAQHGEDCIDALEPRATGGPGGGA